MVIDEGDAVNLLWEMYNEPNIGFWTPKPDVRQYVKLALEVGRALRAAAPDEVYGGPATSTIDLEFLTTCFQAGLLEYWSAVSVHPYRQSPPETVAVEYARLRQMIRRYAPPGARIPILSGEWGFSSAWNNFDVVTQGKFLPRQWLVNLANDVPLSIWYDWHDDGTNPKEPEDRFGTVQHAYFAGREPVYDAKPAYLAARTLTHSLQGYWLSKRLDVGSAEDDHALLFANDAGEVRLAAWTTSPKSQAIVVPASAGRFKVTAHTGGSLPSISADADGLRLVVGDAPQYLAAETPNDLWRLAAAWKGAPLEVTTRAPGRVTLELPLRNPLQRPLRIKATAGLQDHVQPGGTIEVPPGGDVALRFSRAVTRAGMPGAIKMHLDVESLGRIAQSSLLVVDNPLRIVPLMAAGKAFAVRLENPSGEAFRGSLALAGVEGILPARAKYEVQLDESQTEKMISLPLAGPAAAACRFAIRLDEGRGEGQLVVPPTRLTTVDDFARLTSEKLPAAYGLVPDGDRSVVSEHTLSIGVPPEGPPLPGLGCLKIAYRFEPGWKFLCLAPQDGAAPPMAGRPKVAGMWIYGDGTGNTLRLRVVDATGQTLQPKGEQKRHH